MDYIGEKAIIHHAGPVRGGCYRKSQHAKYEFAAFDHDITAGAQQWRH
jgi:hypothetical protein